MKERILEMISDDVIGNIVIEECNGPTGTFFLLEGSPFPEGTLQRKDYLARAVIFSIEDEQNKKIVSRFKSDLSKEYHRLVVEYKLIIDKLDRKTRGT